MDLQIKEADGSYLFDQNGRKYINLSESINILGHRNQDLLNVIDSYLNYGYIHYPLTISTPKIAQQVEKKLLLLSNLKTGKAIFSSSGSEACDIALSILSDFGPVITIQGAYHGLSGQYVLKEQFDMLKYHENFVIPFPYNREILEYIKDLVAKGAKSIIIEVMQVEGGIREVYNEFLQDLKNEFSDLVICVDEAYTGIGKTGKMFAYQWHNFIPDIVIIGKAIGGGIPLGITLINDNIYRKSSFIKKIRNNSFGSTSGNILGLNMADYILNIVSQEQFLNRIQQKGFLFIETLGDEFSDIISGRGLIRGIKVDKNVIDRLIEKLIKDGIYVTKMSNAIRIAPPLTIPDALIIEAGKKIRNILLGT
jgi:acetylornithine/succinyldiaminopimelate/putrescine aminotransferase